MCVKCVYIFRPEWDVAKVNESEQKVKRRFLYVAYNKRSFAHYPFSRFAQFPKCCYLFYTFFLLTHQHKYIHRVQGTVSACDFENKKTTNNIRKFYTWYAYTMLRFTFIYFKWIIFHLLALFHSVSIHLIFILLICFYPNDGYDTHAYVWSVMCVRVHCKYKRYLDIWIYFHSDWLIVWKCMVHLLIYYSAHFLL